MVRRTRRCFTPLTFAVTCLGRARGLLGKHARVRGRGCAPPLAGVTVCESIRPAGGQRWCSWIFLIFAGFQFACSSSFRGGRWNLCPGSWICPFSVFVFASCLRKLCGRYTHTSEGARHKRAGPFVVMKPLPGSPTHLRLMSLSCDGIVCKLAFLWSVLAWHLLPPAHFPSCLCLRLASVCLSALCACGGLGSDCEITSPLRSKTKM